MPRQLNTLSEAELEKNGIYLDKDGYRRITDPDPDGVNEEFPDGPPDNWDGPTAEELLPKEPEQGYGPGYQTSTSGNLYDKPFDIKNKATGGAVGPGIQKEIDEKTGPGAK